MMVPVGRLVLLRSVEKSDLVNALAYLTVPALIGPVAGPPLGGFITTYFHWRWIFWINVPIGILGVALSLKFIANLREEVVPRFDFKGFRPLRPRPARPHFGHVADRPRHGALLGGRGDGRGQHSAARRLCEACGRERARDPRSEAAQDPDLLFRRRGRAHFPHRHRRTCPFSCPSCCSSASA